MAEVCLLAGLVGTAWASPQRLEGKVVRVSDGDTIALLVSGHRLVRIRLADIDAPENCKAAGPAEGVSDAAPCQGRPAQPFSDVSRRHLVRLAAARWATATCRVRDLYGRQVCRVTVDGVDLSEAQAQVGLAWYDTKYGRDRALRVLAERAQANRRGLFRDAAPIEPWRWRSR